MTPFARTFSGLLLAGCLAPLGAACGGDSDQGGGNGGNGGGAGPSTGPGSHGVGGSVAAACGEDKDPTLSLPAGSLSIPSEHPRLFFTPSRLATAKAWYKSHPFEPDDQDMSTFALLYLLTGEESYADTAIAWLMDLSIDVEGVLHDGRLAHATDEDEATWKAPFAGPQEVFVTLAKHVPKDGDEVHLFFGSRGGDGCEDTISLIYSYHSVGAEAVERLAIWTCSGGVLDDPWVAPASADGQTFGARLCGGALDVYLGGVPLTSFDVSGWAYLDEPGRIGIRLRGDPGDVEVDDFGGGSLP